MRQITDPVSVDVNNNTVYTESFRVEPSAQFIAAIVERTAGAGTCAVTLQGALSPDAADADWVDTTLTQGTYNANAPIQLVDADGVLHIFAAWPYYRFKVVSVGAATIVGRVTSA